MGGHDCNSVGAVAQYSLGSAPAKGWTAFGGEILALPVFHASESSTDYIKIPEFLFPNMSARSAMVLDAREFNTEALYNKYVSLFDGSLTAEEIATFNTSYSSSSRPQPHFDTGVFSLDIAQTAIPEGNPVAFLDGANTAHINVPVTVSSPTNDEFGHTDSFFVWPDENERHIGRYFKRDSAVGGNFEPASESEVPSVLIDQDYMEQQHAKNYNQHNGRRQQDWCYDCSPSESDQCDYEVRKVVMQNGAVLRYRWYRFRHQPVFQQLSREFPEKYSEAFLDNMQTVWENIHEQWGSGAPDQFLERPRNRGNYGMARLEPTMIVTPPAGKEFGWVPIVLELKHSEVDWAKGTWLTSNKFGNPLYQNDYHTANHGVQTSNYNASFWSDDDGGAVFGHREQDGMDDDWVITSMGVDYNPAATDWSVGTGYVTIAPTDAPTGATSDALTDAPSDAPTDAPTDAPHRRAHRRAHRRPH
jgi:hypothetical protein